MTLKLSKEDSEIVRDMMWKNIVCLIEQANGTENYKARKTFLTQLDER